MKKTYLVLGILVGVLLTMMPSISAVEYTAARDYNIEQIQNMNAQELLDLVKLKLGGDEPTGIITIVVYFLVGVIQSLIYVIPAFIYFLITLIL